VCHRRDSVTLWRTPRTTTWLRAEAGYKTFLVCNVPRVQCPEHGVVTIRVPWAEGSSRHTAQFEAEVIAWLKEAAANLWNYRNRNRPLAGWHRRLEWASGCGLGPVLKAARMIRQHLWGIVNAIIRRATNGLAEGINSRIKTVNVRSRGFRNRERFANAILFHLGGPRPLPRWPARMTCYPPERGRTPR